MSRRTEALACMCQAFRTIPSRLRDNTLRMVERALTSRLRGCAAEFSCTIAAGEYSERELKPTSAFTFVAPGAAEAKLKKKTGPGETKLDDANWSTSPTVNTRFHMLISSIHLHNAS